MRWSAKSKSKQQFLILGELTERERALQIEGNVGFQEVCHYKLQIEQKKTDLLQIQNDVAYQHQEHQKQLLLLRELARRQHVLQIEGQAGVHALLQRTLQLEDKRKEVLQLQNTVTNQHCETKEEEILNVVGHACVQDHALVPQRKKRRTLSAAFPEEGCDPDEVELVD